MNQEFVTDRAPLAVVAGDGVPHAGDDDREERPGGPGRTDVGVLTRTRAVTKKPAMYRVLLLNDDFTPMDFVVHVLERFFGKNNQEALEIMMHVHRRGVGICGTYTYEVAETKVNLVMDYARKNEHPLQCTMEKE
ncbi:MAG: ATP-dependent Clp protease adapter ClpS [Micavibrio sp.]|nr:ATP-dependent Clp protease adapter ClpS [Micavibrio sp.]